MFLLVGFIGSGTQIVEGTSTTCTASFPCLRLQSCSRMAKDMLTIYLHYEDANQEPKIFQRSMMRRDVSYYDLILMIEEVGFQAIDFLYYTKKTHLGSPYFVHIYDERHVMKMLLDPEIVKALHLYVSKEKVGDDIASPSKQIDIAPSNHPNESVLFQDGGVSESAEMAGKLTMGRTQIDEEVRKRKRTSLPVVWNMPKGQRIVVKCNENSQPIGDEGAILGRFLGTIARNGGFCPLNINDWRDVKKNSGEETILQCIQTKFVYPRSCEKWILKSIARDWRKYKSSLKDAFFKPAIEKNPNIKRKALYKLCPEDVDNDQWHGLVKFWKSKKGRALAEKNIISRSLVKNSHNAGSKSYACWAEDMRQADPEKKRPHRSKVYLATHKKKDDANAKNKVRNERLDRLENLITKQPELAQNLNGRVAWEGDALQEVLGKEKIGQVHGMRLLPTPKQVYGHTPRYLRNINMTTADGSPYEIEHDVWEEIAKMKEHIKRQDQIIEDMNNKEGYVNNGLEEENLQSNDNGISRLPILHGKTKRIQCNGPVEARSSMQHDIYEDNSLSRSHEKAGDHDVNQLKMQQNSSSPENLVIDSVSEVRETRDLTHESFSRLNQQGTTTEQPHPARAKKRRTSSVKVDSKVVLKTSTYPNKRNVAYGTIRSTNPRTKAGGIELGAEFALVRIDQPILDSEELVREVSDCKTIGEAFSSGYLIAWPSGFIREKDK